jgi:hypothetical protein
VVAKYLSRNFNISNRSVEDLMGVIPFMSKLEEINIRLSHQTRVNVDAENKFKMACISCKNIKRKSWNSKNF